MTQNERITKMEHYLDEAQIVIRAFSEVLSAYRKIQPKLRELEDYYSSEEWRRDFEDDEAGRLPHDLKRGVLSEDAIYNLLEENKDLLADISSLASQP